MPLYTGGCHCGHVKVKVETDIREVLECNCSYCAKKGLLLVFVPRESLEVLSGADSQSEYRFNKKAIRHLFCPTCGVQVYSEAEGAEGKLMSAVNVRALEDIDVERLAIKKFHGKDF
ncbi:MAG: GFA family protein [Candidatus Moraniibacteriota bacterium]